MANVNNFGQVDIQFEDANGRIAAAQDAGNEYVGNLENIRSELITDDNQSTSLGQMVGAQLEMTETETTYMVKSGMPKKASKASIRDKTSKKKNKLLKIIKLKKSVEKNDILELDDLEIVSTEKKHQTSFFSNKNFLKIIPIDQMRQNLINLILTILILNQSLI